MEGYREQNMPGGKRAVDLIDYEETEVDKQRRRLNAPTGDIGLMLKAGIVLTGEEQDLYGDVKFKLVTAKTMEEAGRLYDLFVKTAEFHGDIFTMYVSYAQLYRGFAKISDVAHKKELAMRASIHQKLVNAYNMSSDPDQQVLFVNDVCVTGLDLPEFAAEGVWVGDPTLPQALAFARDVFEVFCMAILPFRSLDALAKLNAIGERRRNLHLLLQRVPRASTLFLSEGQAARQAAENVALAAVSAIAMPAIVKVESDDASIGGIPGVLAADSPVYLIQDVLTPLPSPSQMTTLVFAYQRARLFSGRTGDAIGLSDASIADLEERMRSLDAHRFKNFVFENISFNNVTTGNEMSDNTPKRMQKPDCVRFVNPLVYRDTKNSLKSIKCIPNVLNRSYLRVLQIIIDRATWAASFTDTGKDMQEDIMISLFAAPAKYKHLEALTIELQATTTEDRMGMVGKVVFSGDCLSRSLKMLSVTGVRIEFEPTFVTKNLTSLDILSLNEVCSRQKKKVKKVGEEKVSTTTSTVAPPISRLIARMLLNHGTDSSVMIKLSDEIITELGADGALIDTPFSAKVRDETVHLVMALRPSMAANERKLATFKRVIAALHVIFGNFSSEKFLPFNIIDSLAWILLPQSDDVRAPEALNYTKWVRGVENIGTLFNLVPQGSPLLQRLLPTGLAVRALQTLRTWIQSQEKGEPIPVDAAILQEGMAREFIALNDAYETDMAAATTREEKQHVLYSHFGFQRLGNYIDAAMRGVGPPRAQWQPRIVAFMLHHAMRIDVLPTSTLSEVNWFIREKPILQPDSRRPAKDYLDILRNLRVVFYRFGPLSLVFNLWSAEGQGPSVPKRDLVYEEQMFGNPLQHFDTEDEREEARPHDRFVTKELAWTDV